MEPVRFADILFIFLTLLITFAILWVVNQKRNKPNQPTTNPSAYEDVIDKQEEVEKS